MVEAYSCLWLVPPWSASTTTKLASLTVELEAEAKLSELGLCRSCAVIMSLSSADFYLCALSIVPCSWPKKQHMQWYQNNGKGYPFFFIHFLTTLYLSPIEMACSTPLVTLKGDQGSDCVRVWRKFPFSPQLKLALKNWKVLFWKVAMSIITDPRNSLTTER